MTNLSRNTLHFVLLVCGALVTHGFYFLVPETPKCFTFEQPRDTPMYFGYDILDEGREVTFDLYYGSTPKTELQIMHKILSEKKGHIDFMADTDGMYSYCVSQTGQYQSIPARFSITINYGFDQEHYDKLIKDHNFDEINLQVHKLNDLLTMTLNEADFQKHKEVEYHDETERMNTAALWWPVVQIGILVLTGVYQVNMLKNFFKSNKFL